MRVLVVGAAGGIGSQVVAQALKAGHQVTAFLRTPAKLPIRDASLTVRQGDVLDAGSVAGAVAGHDAVVSTIGNNSLKPTTLYSEGTQRIVAAMQAANVSRFFGVSASGLHIDRNDGLLIRTVAKPLVAWILRESYADIARMEAIVARSGLRWTIIVPPRLTKGPRTGAYRTAFNQNVRAGKTAISRADCADYIVRSLEETEPSPGLVFLAY